MLATEPTINQTTINFIDNRLIPGLQASGALKRSDRDLLAGDVYSLAIALCDLATAAAEVVYVDENYPNDSAQMDRAMLAMRRILSRTTIDGR